MKHLSTILALSLFCISYGQSESQKEKFRQLEPDIWLGIWDKENSSELIKIDTLSYDEIPKNLDFRGTVVEALKWNDALGVNILIQTVTGHFNWIDYDNDSSDYTIQDKSELYAYLFRKNNDNQTFQRIWKVYDFIACFGVDWYTGFIPKATTITDLNNNGISEVSIPYVLICRGGMDPGVMKIIMYEDHNKYALRGTTRLMCESEHAYGGEFTSTQNLKLKKLFMDFLSAHWNLNKCEKGRYY